MLNPLGDTRKPSRPVAPCWPLAKMCDATRCRSSRVITSEILARNRCEIRSLTIAATESPVDPISLRYRRRR